ncbi:MAG: 50S ribosomal protein L16 [Nanoarchaeota archaeon]
MALRKAGAYSKRYARPYTRKSKVKQKSYIKTVPNSKIVKLRMGDLPGYSKGRFPIILKINAKEEVQLRDNALEAVRQFLNRFLIIKTNKDFYFEVKIYPHHILRENKMLTGAGADRMQTGMSQAFGKTIGRAARIKNGQTLFIIGVLNSKHESEARKLIASARAKLPCKVAIETERKI